jgi:hypothetical protein
MKETGPGHFGAIDKNLTPSQEIKKENNEIEIIARLNSLKSDMVVIMDKDYRGDENQKIRDLDDIQQKIDNLTSKLEATQK